jgi:predicted enzyme related to lactoylglutathione lyase
MTHGAIVFVEIPVLYLQRAADFYAGTFGWTFEVESPSRWQFSPGSGGAMGAITTSRIPTTSGPRLVIEVDDIDAALSRAKALGGQVEQGRTVVTSTFGDNAIISDPDGTHLFIFQSRMRRLESRQADLDSANGEDD